jgi:hypothetical protein
VAMRIISSLSESLYAPFLKKNSLGAHHRDAKREFWKGGGGGKKTREFQKNKEKTPEPPPPSEARGFGTKGQGGDHRRRAVGPRVAGPRLRQRSLSDPLLAVWLVLLRMLRSGTHSTPPHPEAGAQGHHHASERGPYPQSRARTARDVRKKRGGQETAGGTPRKDSVSTCRSGQLPTVGWTLRRPEARTGANHGAASTILVVRD